MSVTDRGHSGEPATVHEAWLARDHCANGKVVVLEVAERNLLSGTSPILFEPVIAEIANQRSQHRPPQ